MDARPEYLRHRLLLQRAVNQMQGATSFELQVERASDDNTLASGVHQVTSLKTFTSSFVLSSYHTQSSPVRPNHRFSRTIKTAAVVIRKTTEVHFAHSPVNFWEVTEVAFAAFHILSPS